MWSCGSAIAVGGSGVCRKNTSFDVLKVNLLVSRGTALHVDSFDLYSAKHRQAFARLAAAELELEESVIPARTRKSAAQV